MGTIARWLGNCIILLLSSPVPINSVAEAGHQMQDAASGGTDCLLPADLWDSALRTSSRDVGSSTAQVAEGKGERCRDGS